jgi:16S rRNA (adenine1518-N6/adenine1519-N6)-dimethyltransferase
MVKMEKRRVMATLGTPGSTIDLLRKHKINIQKKYGQNFLIDTNILKKVIQAAYITGEDHVLEIGPGIGTMTQYLAEIAGWVTAVEIDKVLIPVLRETLGEYANVSIINADILKVDINRLVRDMNWVRPVKVVANLPYYITTPIIMRLLESRAFLHSITVMVQKEVADRMQVGPGTKDYGALSLAVQYYTRPEIIAKVPQGCFIPAPKVESTVIKLTLHKTPPIKVADEGLMFALIRASFNQRRKTLVNGIGNAVGLDIEKERVKDALLEMGLPADVRGETLDLGQFAELSNLLKDM